jgi:hypothetical protein
MKRLLLILVMFACAGLPDLAHALTCPNRPAGSTTLATVHFNTNDGEGQLWDLYPGAGTITTVSGSEGSVSASILAPGASVGGQQVIWPKPGNQQPLNNIYVCLRFQMAPGYVGQQTANKLFFVAAQDWPFSSVCADSPFTSSDARLEIRAIGLPATGLSYLSRSTAVTVTASWPLFRMLVGDALNFE